MLEPPTRSGATYTQASQPGHSLLVRLPPSDPFPSALLDLLQELEGGNWLVLGGIGMLKESELGYFDGSEYHKATFPEPLELVSLQGTVVAHGPEGGPTAHLHAILADQSHQTVAGHLFQAQVGVTLEVNLLSLDGPAARAMEPSGLALLQLDSAR